MARGYIKAVRSETIHLVISLLLSLPLLACDEGGGAKNDCVPGETRECGCPGGFGEQVVCLGDEPVLAWSECSCGLSILPDKAIIDFGVVCVHSTVTGTANFTNKLRVPVTVDVKIVSGRAVFNVTPEGDKVLPPYGGVMEVRVSYTPDDIGSDEGTMVITTSLSGDPMKVITLTGKGVDYSGDGGVCDGADSGIPYPSPSAR